MKKLIFIVLFFLVSIFICSCNAPHVENEIEHDIYLSFKTPNVNNEINDTSIYYITTVYFDYIKRTLTININDSKTIINDIYVKDITSYKNWNISSGYTYEIYKRTYNKIEKILTIHLDANKTTGYIIYHN